MRFLYSVLVCATVAFVSIGQASAQDQIIIQTMEADLAVEYDDNGIAVTVSLLANHSRGTNVIAAGSTFIIPDGSDVMGVEPSPFNWVLLQDINARIPPDGAAILTFSLSPHDGSTVMGVEPSPFYGPLSANTLVMRDLGGGPEQPVSLGTLDFREVSGRLGSLHLEEVGLTDRPVGADIQIDPLIIGQAAVEIDIKPGSDQNTINLSSAGVIPVAILSSVVFDATTVDPDTVSLAGARVRVVGRGNRALAHIEDVNGDGLDDLLCQVETADFLVEIGESTALLEAETFDGIEIHSQDIIRIVPD